MFMALSDRHFIINVKIITMLTLGFSPCPNDTFIFYGLANRKIDLHGLEFDIVMEDVETLNRLAVEGRLDITKVSTHAFYYLQDHYCFLRAGSAIGRGCGPLVVARNPIEMRDLIGKTVAVPGGLTTAVLLFKLYFASSMSFNFESIKEMPFHKIMGAVQAAEVDAGLIIHEGRFTYPSYGLSPVMDLGEWWEKETGMPIPLGGIIARRALGEGLCSTIENIIRASVNYSLENRAEAMPYIRNHSQELSEDVINNHIALYVNDFTVDMKDAGTAALNELILRVDTVRRCAEGAR
jgi:1,4-dihydroxy-6-naphthoate synthase